MKQQIVKGTSLWKSAFYLFSVLILIWLSLTRNLSLKELIPGLTLSAILTLTFSKQYSTLGFPRLSIKKAIYSLLYIAVLLKEIVAANFDVAYRVLHPKMPIKPGIVVIKTQLKQDIAKLILANSITLTPGTFTLDIKEDRLLIHWIYVRSSDTEEATRMIGERFEKYLKVIFT